MRSVPALEDLKKCLEKTNQQEELVQHFRQSLFKRLLQPGANTFEILQIYVSTIKAFRILDPKGVLLEALSEPVKEVFFSSSLWYILHDVTIHHALLP